MSEATEFLVFCSALRETPERLRRLIGGRVGEREQHILERMAQAEETALAWLEALLDGETELPGGVSMATGGALQRFLAARQRLLDRLDCVNVSLLHRAGRLPSGRLLDPWRLAGNLIDHDVRCLAELGLGLRRSADG